MRMATDAEQYVESAMTGKYTEKQLSTELRENRSICYVHPGKYWGPMAKDLESTA